MANRSFTAPLLSSVGGNYVNYVANSSSSSPASSVGGNYAFSVANNSAPAPLQSSVGGNFAFSGANNSAPAPLLNSVGRNYAFSGANNYFPATPLLILGLCLGQGLTTTCVTARRIQDGSPSDSEAESGASVSEVALDQVSITESSQGFRRFSNDASLRNYLLTFVEAYEEDLVVRKSDDGAKAGKDSSFTSGPKEERELKEALILKRFLSEALDAAR